MSLTSSVWLGVWGLGSIFAAVFGVAKGTLETEFGVTESLCIRRIMVSLIMFSIGLLRCGKVFSPFNKERTCKLCSFVSRDAHCGTPHLHTAVLWQGFLLLTWNHKSKSLNSWCLPHNSSFACNNDLPWSQQTPHAGVPSGWWSSTFSFGSGVDYQVGCLTVVLKATIVFRVPCPIQIIYMTADICQSGESRVLHL